MFFQSHRILFKMHLAMWCWSTKLWGEVKFKFYSRGILFWHWLACQIPFCRNLCLCVGDIWWHDIFASPQFTELCKNAVSFHSDQFSHSITHSNTWTKQKQHIPIHCFCHRNFTFIIKLDLLLVSLIIFCFVDLIQHLWAWQYSGAVGLACHVKASQNLEKVIC